MNKEDMVTLALIEQRLDQVLEQQGKILYQVTSTNGRVTKLEMWRATLNGVHTAVVIAVSIIAFAIGSILTYLAI